MHVSSFDTIAIEHSDKLTQLIRSEIKGSSNQSITFARFMELALYSPGLGYYSAGSHKLGKKGDFVTAPEISPLFAQCIASQASKYYANESGNFLELGAGSGVFAKDFMTQLKKDGCLPKYYYILEVSAELQERQRQFLLETCPDLFSHFVWLDRLPENFEGIIFANEVFDALPVHCFEKNETILERCVTYTGNHFEWCLRKPSEALPPTPLPHKTRAGGILDETFCMLEKEVALPVGYQSEINLLAPQLMTSLVKTLQKGFILLFDYGYGRREYYHPERTQGTLKCFYQHQSHSNPFLHIGLQDITCHVDFTSLVISGVAAGAALLGYTTQTSYLLSSDLLKLADHEALTTQEKYNQAQAIKTLTLPSEMGELIKVMLFSKNTEQKLGGFELMDRRRDL